ncbi:carboxymuconolactone decarboxylase family protein [Micromonospora sp. WMMD1082]|uniref:carboxymuconolactone decarboxylase family protein n=1 Tax=Micromonospora sp. WMMD1082 TaxID=3016104 RepID=UPI002415A5E6|nr:carboxymuconolactone decarboxylase family protein [Micromonospora sp. WMMD1082]MDG4793440.1 carboxymuconolactone decarboxylase family protein [Micromonospora sp. WMMD1082]
MVARRVASSVVQRQVKYVTPVSVGAATGMIAGIYGQIQEEQRLVIPPALLHSPAPETLAAYWMLMREPLMTGGVVDRAGKEAVASAVSVANICPYCVDMHSVGMYDLATEHDAEAVAADRIEDVLDARTRWAAQWARTAHLADGPALEPPMAGPVARAELVGVVVSFHYLTRMVNVFLSNFLLPPGLPPGARRRLKRGISAILQSTLRTPREPGRSLRFLADAPLPADAAWARGSAVVAAAVARSYAALEAAGERALSPVVRDLVREHLAGWRGEDTGVSREWCERTVSGLAAADAAAARLALLTAVASYQVDEHVIEEFRRHHVEDATLVRAAAWASYVAARAIGARHVPAQTSH